MSQLRLLESPSPPARNIRFGPFVLDVRAGELRKHGIRIRLGYQTLQVLLLLLERPGEVVLREEIRRKLWPDNTVVEFDHSINAAVQKVRDALGDSADKPRYIETLTRRGYRFIGTVETDAPAEAARPGPAGEHAGTENSAQAGQAVLRPRLTRVAAAVLVVLLALSGWLWLAERRAPEQNLALSLGLLESAVVSPDGSAVAYRKPGGVYLRRLDSVAEIPVYTQSPAIDSPAWSPDGSQLLFPTLTALVRLPLPDGPPSAVCPTVGPPRGATWSRHGVILQAAMKADRSALYMVPAAGGTPAEMEIPELKGGTFFYPEFLPDGRNFLFAWATDGQHEAGLYLATLRYGRIVRGPLLLRKNVTAGRFSPWNGGTLLYVQDDNLYAQTLNVGDGRLEGDPVRVVEGVLTTSGFRRAHFSVSRSGVLLWRTGRTALAQLTWFDRQGKPLETAGPLCEPTAVLLSPDEQHVLLQTATGGSGVVGARGNGLLPLPGIVNARWVRSSSRIIYRRRTGDGFVLVGSGAQGDDRKEIIRLPGLMFIQDVSPDGTTVLYSSSAWSLHSIRIEPGSGNPAPQPVVTAEERVISARFSPDGRWIAYSSGDSEKSEVYVQPFPAGGLRKQVSLSGGRGPVWRGDGKEILFRRGNSICSVSVEVRNGEIRTDAPRVLFEVRTPVGLPGNAEPLAITADGTRILFAQAAGQPGPQATHIMTAWHLVMNK